MATQPRQLFFFVEVNHITKGTQLFRTFNFAGETGVPWQSSSIGQYKSTHWQAIDICPAVAWLDVGDQVEVIISTAGCAGMADIRYVYVGFPARPDHAALIFVTATLTGNMRFAPDAGRHSELEPRLQWQRTVNYNYYYSNGGDAPRRILRWSSRPRRTGSRRRTKRVVTKYQQQNLRRDPSFLTRGRTHCIYFRA